MMRIFILVSMLTLNLFAAAAGELSLYILKDGKPLPKQHVVIFQLPKQESNAFQAVQSRPEGTEFISDEQGYLAVALPEGNYQLQLVAKEHGVAQAYVKKNFAIAASKQTQIILSLRSDNTLQFTDMEAPATVKETALKTEKKAAKGSVALTLLSAENGEPVVGARVFVAGLKTDTVSNKKGQVLLDIPEGNQTISVIHTAFSSQSVKIAVVPNEMISKTVELSPASMELDEYVVLAPHIEGSVASVIAEERNSDAVGNVLGSEQFSKSGDGNAAAALKRVSGVTIVGGKYVYVRGLGDRYSTVMMNDLHIPSPEPTKRVVPLDIFPTSVIQSIAIQKSYTADLPASFAGGTVLIRTKDVPEGEEGYASGSVTFYMNDSTGKQAMTNGDNSVGLPSSVISASDNFHVINGGDQSLTNDALYYRSLNHEYTTLDPGVKVEISAGDSYDITDNFSIGASGTLYYKNTSESNQVDFEKYVYNIDTKETDLDSKINADVTTLDTQYAGMLNLATNIYETNTLKYTLFATYEETDETTFSHTDYSGAIEDKDKTYYAYNEKLLLMNQFSGHHDLRFGRGTDGYFDNLVVDWAAETAKATRLEPGTVEYTYLYQSGGVNWNQSTNYYYYDLKDDVTNYRADFKLPYEFNGNENYTQAGAFVYNKSRKFDERKFYMTDFAASGTGIDLSQPIDQIYADASQGDFRFMSNDADQGSYKATQDVYAGYLKQLFSLTHDLDLIGSVRMESSTQQLIRTKTGYKYDPLETSDLFPSLGLTYRFGGDMQVRAAYSHTITRPDFREFSPNKFQDPVTGNTVFGNPYLQPTYIDNYDLKYEWYFAADEMFSFGLFAKEFTDPIEQVVRIDPVDGNQLLQTYRNAASATSYGAELDLRKRFGFIAPALDKLLFATNLAYIQSDVKLKTDANDTYVSNLTSKSRPMQGQSPYVINVQFGYDDPVRGDSALFMFNQIGERIAMLGTNGNKDMYEQPFAKLDFVTLWKLNNYIFTDSDLGFLVKFKATNILDSEKTMTQGDKTVYRTKPGREFELSLKITY